MKKNLLVILSLFLLISFAIPVNGQQFFNQDMIPGLYFYNGIEGYQLVKLETFNYNTSIFEDLQMNASESDSVPGSITDIQYDNNEVTTVTSSWMQAKWQMQLKTQTFIRNEMNIDSMMLFMYDTVSNGWKRNTKIVNNYEGELQTESETYTVDSLTGVWNLMMQTAYDYNSSGYLTSEITSNYNPDSSKWMYSSKTDYFLNASGSTDSIKTYYWVPFTEDWMVNSLTVYEYDNMDNVTSETSYSQGILNPGWQKTGKTMYTYNAEGNQTLQLDYSWDLLQLDWALDSKDSIVYDNGTRPLAEFSYQSPLTVNEIFLHTKTFFSYDLASRIDENLQSNNISVFPNPATEFISVKTSHPGNGTVRLFDLKGTLVYEKAMVSETTSIPVRNLVKGSYLIKVRSKSNVRSQIVLIK